MADLIDAAFAAAASSNSLRFIVFVVSGLCAGWLLARPGCWSSSPFCLTIMGVCGAWIGAELAYLIGQADPGGSAALGAALFGSIALPFVWRRLREPARDDEGNGVALHPPHA